MRQCATILFLERRVKFLTIDDVCEMLSISRRTLERMRSPSSKSIRELMEPGGITSSIELDILHKDSKRKRVYFPDPDLNIGNSPRWERDKLLAWLEKNGSHL